MKKIYAVFAGILLLGVLLGGCFGDTKTAQVKVADKNVIYVEHRVGSEKDPVSYLAATDSVVNMDKREIVITCPCYPTDGYGAIGMFLPSTQENTLKLSFSDDRTYRVIIWRLNEKHVYHFPPVKN